MRNEASQAQVGAADPATSTWLSANAGSGKTRVLIDRVARLLLAGTSPQRILCLTYTNAAASEMQNRLFRRLGEWAMKPEAALARDLADLGAPTADLAEARRLFARAIETPGGLRIQTIHSFCATLLRRFPLEAHVPPQFTEIDEQTQDRLVREILDEMAEGPQATRIKALAHVFSEKDLFPAIKRLTSLRRKLGAGDRPQVLKTLGLPAGATLQDLAEQAAAAFRPGWREAMVAVLAPGSSRDATLSRGLAALTPDRPDLRFLLALEELLLVKTGDNAGRPKAQPTKASRTARPDLFQPLDDLALLVEALRPRRQAIQLADQAMALADFAQAFLPRFAEAKAQRGWLDFDDLIERAETLLTHPSVAAWVLFRLDGGIDHILVDEAQDTSPEQWRVIELLTQEFSAGFGARGPGRTLFVVGDKKQSIYSFQGADVTGFDLRAGQFRVGFQSAGLSFAARELRHSFRSSPVILSVVDQVFAQGTVSAMGDDVRHLPFHPDLPGRVELWPLVEATPDKEDEDDEAWTAPLDQVAPQAPEIVLSQRLAARIKAMIGTAPVPLAQGGSRPARAGDFLILVRRRSGVFQHLLRACKAQGLPVAGADRLALTEELAVRDLMALLSVVATPEDDLSLAAVLRSPLFGWSEDDLFRLAQGRGGFLWESLRAHGGPALEILQDLRDQADFLRPHDLLDRALTRHRGRVRLLARLGEEVEDSIDALLAQALAYEQVEVPSLDGFLAWMLGGEATIKRQLGEAADRVRIMTVHGAKGLEGEIVILPDTNNRRPPNGRTILLDATGHPYPTAGQDDRPPHLATLMADQRAREEDEALRLLYVALTRARTQLIVAAAGKADETSWHGRVRLALAALGAATGPEGALVLQSATWPAAPNLAASPDEKAIAETIPDWALARVAPARPRPGPVSPSALGGAKALAGGPTTEEDATARGTAIHLLLQHLPGQDPARWQMLARALVSDAALCDEALAIARRLIEDPALAALFGPDSLAEVPIVGRLSDRPAEGALDRLIVTPHLVLAVDFKSNRLVPALAQEVPEAILRQMGAYAALLAGIYPGRRVETAVLWTETGRLMPLSDEIVRDALQRATKDWGAPLDVPINDT